MKKSSKHDDTATVSPSRLNQTDQQQASNKKTAPCQPKDSKKTLGIREKGRSISCYSSNVSTARSCSNTIENYETPKSLVTNSNNTYFYGESDVYWTNEESRLLNGKSTKWKENQKSSSSKKSQKDLGTGFVHHATFPDEYFEIEETDDSIQNFASDIITQAKNSLFNDKIKVFNEVKNASVRASLNTGRFMEFRTEATESKSFCLTPKNGEKFRKQIFSTENYLDSPTFETISKTKPSLKVNLDLNQIFFQGKVFDEDDEILSERSTRNMDGKASFAALNIPDKELERVDTIDVVFQHEYLNISSSKRESHSDEQNLQDHHHNQPYFKNELYKHSISMSLTREETNEKLTECIYFQKIGELENILRNSTKLALNAFDHRGNTPLLLAVKLLWKSKDYFEIIRILLSYGADPSIKDKTGWSALDEAVSRCDVMIISLLFDYLMKMKRMRINEEMNRINDILAEIPDFYIEMKWEFDSSMIPLFSVLAPSDTFKIWKYGNSVRLDNNLVGFKKLKAKRRDMSVIYNPRQFKLTPNALQFNREDSVKKMWILNRSKKTFTNPLQEVDITEKKYILQDFLRADPVQGNFDVKDCSFVESKSWLGNMIEQRISNFNTKRFEFKVTYDYLLQRKIHQPLTLDFRAYTNRDPTLMARVSKIVEEPPEHETSTNFDKKTSEKILKKNIGELDLSISETSKKVEKKASVFCWIAEHYPLKIKDILPLVALLSNGNQMLQDLQKFLEKNEIQNILLKNGFPVKLQIPLAYSIRATITFSGLRMLEPGPAAEELFKIPADYEYVDRKIAQKTLIRPKKRMVLANMLI